MEDLSGYQYRGLDLQHNANDKTQLKYCSECRHMIHHIKKPKVKESNKIDRFAPLGTKTRKRWW